MKRYGCEHTRTLSAADLCITLQAPLTPFLVSHGRLLWLVFNRNADDLHFHINECSVRSLKENIWKLLAIILLSDDLGKTRWLLVNAHLSLRPTQFHIALQRRIIFVIALSKIRPPDPCGHAIFPLSCNLTAHSLKMQSLLDTEME